MANDFTFKQFHIYGHQCGMPVSTDGVLLGAWADIISSVSILDIGCGTGLLSLMAAQRNSKAKITAIEIERHAFQAALNNCQQSVWAERINVIHANIASFNPQSERFDSIICNPPYFTSGEVSSIASRATARHTNQLSHQDLIGFCSELLIPGGKASFILPKYEGDQFITLIESSLLSLTRLTQIRSTPTKPVSRLLIEITLNSNHNKSEAVECAELLIHQGSNYSDAFITLTKDFYLKM